MKILQINAFYGFGSTGRIVKQLDNRITAENYDSYICYGRDVSINSYESKNIFKVGTKRDYIVHKLTTHILGYQNLSSVRATEKLVRYIEQIKPDIIHLHILHGHYLNIRVLFNYIRKKDIPVVWTFHDCWAFTGHCGYFFDVCCDKWKDGCELCPLKKSYPRSMFFDRSREQWLEKKELYSQYQNLHIVTVSKWLEKLVIDSFLRDRDIRTIYNGVDCSIFYPRNSYGKVRNRLGLNNEKIILGVASGWTERKGIADFIEIASKISEDTRIVLVGKTPEKMVLPKNVIKYGSVSNQDELAEIYSAAEVFVNPSRQESFGLTTAEAMACGTPAIVYDVTASPEIVGIDEASGACARAYDVLDLFDKVKTYIKEKREPNYYAIRRINDIFSKDKCLNQYIELYEEIVHGKSIYNT